MFVLQKNIINLHTLTKDYIKQKNCYFFKPQLKKKLNRQKRKDQFCNSMVYKNLKYYINNNLQHLIYQKHDSIIINKLIKKKHTKIKLCGLWLLRHENPNYLEKKNQKTTRLFNCTVE